MERKKQLLKMIKQINREDVLTYLLIIVNDILAELNSDSQSSL